MTKSKCSKGFNLRLRAVFCCAILLFADLERAGGEVIMADGEITMAGDEVTMAGGEVMAGGEAMIAGSISGPLHPTTHHSQNYSQHVLLNT